MVFPFQSQDADRRFQTSLESLLPGIEGVSDVVQWREDTKNLWQYLRRDFTDFEEQLEALYPNTSNTMIRQPVAFIYRLARELSTFYVRKPSRSWYQTPGMQTDGNTITEDTERMISRLYTSLGVDHYMGIMQEQLVSMGNAVCWVWPNQNGIRLLVTPPHHNEVIMSDPSSGHIRDVEQWNVMIPAGTESLMGSVQYAVAAITKETAVWITAPDGTSGQGIWREDGSNPYGIIPVLPMRSGEPMPGLFFAPAPQDLLAAQRALCLNSTDVNHCARMQSYGQAVVVGTNKQFTESVELGPDTIVGLPDPEQDFKYVNSKAELHQYMDVTASYARTVSTLNGLNPATLVKESSASITAVAKQYDLLDRETERSRNMTQFWHAEDSLYYLLRRVKNVEEGAEVLPPARVEISYHDPVKPILDPLHGAQARRLAIDDGITTPAEWLAKNQGISQEEARFRVRQNLIETRRNRSILAPDQRIQQDRVPSTEGEANVKA